jgi:hypothetical protein
MGINTGLTTEIKQTTENYIQLLAVGMKAGKFGTAGIEMIQAIH